MTDNRRDAKANAPSAANIGIDQVVIYGAGGHGKVIADIIEKNGGNVIAFADDNRSLWNHYLYGYPVWGGLNHLLQQAVKLDFRVIIAVGGNSARQQIHSRLEQYDIAFATALHPSAQLARGVKIGAGTVVMAGGIINPGSRIGRHCIVNTAATIDHDCTIGDFVHVSPGAHLGGTVRVDDLSWIGLGASVINNVHVAQRVIVGAGTVVINDVEPDRVVVGNPAKILRKNHF